MAFAATPPGAGPWAPQLSLVLPTFQEPSPRSWSHIADYARAAEQARFDRVLVSDHVALGEHLDQYERPELGGRPGRKQLTGPDGSFLEPMLTLATVAAVTSTIRLGTHVLLAALRRPVVLAKQAATLDVLSNGRLDLGVGVGWQREEFQAAGLDFSRRGYLLDHTLEVCTALWAGGPADYSSPDLEFRRIHQHPKPLQAGGVPIWVGGSLNARTVSRLRRFGAGWIPWGYGAAELAAAIPRMRQQVDNAGGDGRAIKVAATLRPAWTSSGGHEFESMFADTGLLTEAGVTDFRIPLPVALDLSDPADPVLLPEELFRCREAFRQSLPSPVRQP